MDEKAFKGRDELPFFKCEKGAPLNGALSVQYVGGGRVFLRLEGASGEGSGFMMHAEDAQLMAYAIMKRIAALLSE